jgi:hypothetical protein
MRFDRIPTNQTTGEKGPKPLNLNFFQCLCTPKKVLSYYNERYDGVPARPHRAPRF